MSTANQPPAGALGPANTVRIGLLGMYISRNLGDTAIQLAVMEGLRLRRQDIAFVGLCQEPEDTVRTFGIPALASSGEGPLIVPGGGLPVVENASPTRAGKKLPRAISRMLTPWRTHRWMASLDMLLVSGSGQIDDFWGGPWAQPFRLLSWCRAARVQRKPVVVLGVGVDELTTRLGAWFSRRALQLADLAILRDVGSVHSLRAMGVRSDLDVCPDPAFHTPWSGAGRHDTTRTFAVLSPISRSAWPGAADATYDAYLTALAAVADELQRRGIEVRFVCSQVKMDPPIVERVRSRMQTDSRHAPLVEVSTVEEYLRAVAGAAVFVGSRLHSVILALVSGTPVVAISYARKVRQLLTDLALERYLFDLTTVNTSELLAGVLAALEQRDALRQHIADYTRGYRRDLDLAFDRVAAQIPSQSRVRDGRRAAASAYADRGQQDLDIMRGRIHAGSLSGRKNS